MLAYMNCFFSAGKRLKEKVKSLACKCATIIYINYIYTCSPFSQYIIIVSEFGNFLILIINHNFYSFRQCPNLEFRTPKSSCKRPSLDLPANDLDNGIINIFIIIYYNTHLHFIRFIIMCILIVRIAQRIQCMACS